jgi:hypothetical protein
MEDRLTTLLHDQTNMGLVYLQWRDGARLSPPDREDLRAALGSLRLDEDDPLTEDVDDLLDELGAP